MVSWRWTCRLLYSERWRRVVWYVATDVFEGYFCLNGNLHNLKFSLYVISVIETRMMTRARHAARMGEWRNAHKDLSDSVMLFTAQQLPVCFKVTSVASLTQMWLDVSGSQSVYSVHCKVRAEAEEAVEQQMYSLWGTIWSWRNTCTSRI